MEQNGINIVDDNETNTGSLIKEAGLKPLENPIDSVNMDGINIIEESDESVLIKSSASGADAENLEPSPKKTRKHPGELQRKSRLIQEREAEIADLRAENERLIRETQQAQYYAKQNQMIAAHKDQIATINHENALVTRYESAKKELKDAMDEGDNDKVAELTATIAATATQLQDLQNKKNRYEALAQEQQHYYPEYDNSPPPPRRAPKEEYDYQDDTYDDEHNEDVKEYVEDFFIENPWADPKNKQQFNPRLHKRFIETGEMLADKYWMEGNKDYLDSKEFLDEVKSHVYKGLDPKVTSIKSNKEQRSTSMVAPVGRGSGGGQSSQGPINLSRAEADVLVALTKNPELNEMMKGKSLHQLAASYKKNKDYLASIGKLKLNSYDRYR